MQSNVHVSTTRKSQSSKISKESKMEKVENTSLAVHKNSLGQHKKGNQLSESSGPTQQITQKANRWCIKKKKNVVGSPFCRVYQSPGSGRTSALPARTKSLRASDEKSPFAASTGTSRSASHAAKKASRPTSQPP